ncbi:DUF4387 family protein [Pontivivens nitratireducens]|uniref:DUF4387 domain-containing protein n=1 Tax=Pontivivens nitratireducens TaxID=2758038 RepID=A0A6G7VNG0_9RHOB|nr:DUF4387 family protein [Pontibrevibacter nitratireducens]QIK41623.1 DUF4387 domain-containing protein [Pontibrevibacter nitratireducens]
MSTVGDIAHKVRSKNAGPFWLTVDVFCGTPDAFARISQGLDSADVAAALQVDPGVLKRFDLANLNVVKFSAPRPAIQGTRADRDMHGASFAVLIAELPL